MTSIASGAAVEKSAPVTGRRAGEGPTASAIVVRDLSHRYDTRTALMNVSFTIAAGEVFGFLGPNGSGKTTLFKILTTLLRPSSGNALVFDSDVVRDSARVRHMLGVAFQLPSLDGKLSCAENLRHHGHLYGLRGGELQHRIDELLKRFGLAERYHERTEKLSGGLRRRVELAKAVLHRPRLLLLDEPATGLDPGARQDLWRDLTALREQEGVTIVLTTHLMDEAERCDRLAIMNHGQIVALGSPDELKAEIGGDVIYVEAMEPDRLALDIHARLNVDAQVVDGRVRIEQPSAHTFITTLIESFPGVIQSVRVGKPTLEDVFVHRTGHTFWDEEKR
jgi:ABC-2 type transport system ATP-binding protein